MFSSSHLETAPKEQLTAMEMHIERSQTDKTRPHLDPDIRGIYPNPFDLFTSIGKDVSFFWVK